MLTIEPGIHKRHPKNMCYDEIELSAQNRLSIRGSSMSMIYRPGWYKNTNISSNALPLTESEK